MATPSSSATSPSPPMTYLAPTPGPAQHPPAAFMDPVEQEHRQKAIQKFMARAEISTITRALRTNLSYASYKAAHNIHHVPLRDLEAQSQSQSQSASFSRTIAAKRKAAGNNNYYNNPATQGPHAATAASSSSLRRGGSGSMLPPSTTSSPRTYYPAVNGSTYATTSNNDSGSSSRVGTSKQSLYTSILAPPPAKHARTIHNAGDPPVPASSRPLASPRARAPKPVSSRSTADANRSHTKSRKLDHPSSPRSPNTRKAKRSPTDKGKQRRIEMGMDVDGDVDMKAAATLTSLLLHHRPSITTGSATSPRSSIDGSEAGSAYSYSHFAQSSARTISAASPPGPVSAAASTSTVTEASFRNTTPPPPTAAGPENSSATPRPAPTDNEAASLMLYLATSPSPVRPTNANKDSRDLVAYRALGGGPPGVLRDKGRVLFASGSSTEHGAAAAEASKPKPHALARGDDTSFNSSMSSIGTEVGGGSVMTPTGTAPAPTQLLPPHTLPAQKPASGASSPAPKAVNESPRQVYAQASVEFNFSDFIHGSPSGPSPSRGPVVLAPKANLGLRADVGRKLFEEEQMRHATRGSQSPGKRREAPRPLGAGIDLVHSS